MEGGLNLEADTSPGVGGGAFLAGAQGWSVCQGVFEEVAIDESASGQSVPAD